MEEKDQEDVLIWPCYLIPYLWYQVHVSRGLPHGMPLDTWNFVTISRFAPARISIRLTSALRIFLIGKRLPIDGKLL